MPLSYLPSGISLNINGSAAFPQATYKRSYPIARQVLFLTGVPVLSVSYERSSLPYPPFLICSFNLSLRGSQSTVQTNIHTLISLFTL